jgi:hypothetical protein
MMLQRAASGLYSPSRWVNWRRGLVTGPTSLLLKYVAILALVTAVGCLYLWQASSLRDMQVRTAELRTTRIELEQANVNLVNQLALWNNPAYVESRSKAGGYTAPESYVLVDPEVKNTVAQRQSGPTR